MFADDEPGGLGRHPGHRRRDRHGRVRVDHRRGAEQVGGAGGQRGGDGLDPARIARSDAALHHDPPHRDGPRAVVVGDGRRDEVDDADVRAGLRRCAHRGRDGGVER